MARTWLSIRVELVEGRGERRWPRPGRLFAAARGHSFAALATAIDDAFARWDRAHLHEFRLADGTRLTTPYGDDDELGPALDDRRAKLSRLRPGEQFLYTFDLGDGWTHLCTVGSERIDPEERAGHRPRRTAALLRVGRHSRPVRASLGRGRRRGSAARGPGFAGGAGSPHASADHREGARDRRSHRTTSTARRSPTSWTGSGHVIGTKRSVPEV